MGNPCCTPVGYVVGNQAVPAEQSYDRDAPKISGIGQVHMLICALDYKNAQPDVPRLTCTVDGRNMADLAAACRIQDVVQMYDDQCTKEALLAQIQQVGARCGPDDYFVLYYSGHGTQVADEDGDEDDDYDEAMALVNSLGQVEKKETYLVDDDLAVAITQAVDQSARIIVLTDCCHSATICDFDRDVWEGRQAVSISSALDKETATDTGKGGVFTNAMLLAVDLLQEEGSEDYSIGLLFNATIEYDFRVWNSKQMITLTTPWPFSPDEMAWPFIPYENYLAPLSRVCEQGHIRPGDDVTNLELALQSPQYLALFGISENIRSGLVASRIVDIVQGKKRVSMQELMNSGSRCYNAQKAARKRNGACLLLRKNCACTDDDDE